MIELFSSLFVTGAVLISYFTVSTDPYAAAETALALNSSFVLIGILQYLGILFTDIQSSLTSVQRMQEYSNLDQEKDAYLPSDNQLPPNWPLQGAITFN